MIEPNQHPPITAHRRTQEAQANNAALRLLAIRPRTVNEMRQRLSARFGAAAAEKTITRLQAQGLLNDAAFAQQWRNSRERRKPRSQGMIQRELRAKGVADEIISQTLEGYDSAAAAHRAAAHYAARQSGGGRAVFDRRVGAFLSRRGFNGETIRQTLERLREELQVTRAESSED